MKLSALVCACNDEARLADCLRRLAFCDEIVVVADRCTDRSQEIARQFGARVIDGIFPMESQRKAAGLEACRGEWVLEVEPNEVVDAKLAYEIRAAIHGRPSGDWFNIPLHNYIGETLVRRGWAEGGLSPRLFRRHVKRWITRRVEPGVVMTGRHACDLETPLLRQADLDVGQMMARLDRQTWLRAQDLADLGQTGGVFGALLTGFGRFARCYVLRQGMREGEAGFLIALMAGLDPLLSALRAREILRARTLAAAAPATALEPARIGRAG